MTDLGEIGTATIVTPNCGTSIIQVVTDNAPHAADTLTVDLTQYGCRNIHGILAFRETSSGIIVTDGAPTTAVASGVLTITVGTGANDKIRMFQIFAY